MYLNKFLLTGWHRRHFEVLQLLDHNRIHVVQSFWHNKLLGLTRETNKKTYKDPLMINIGDYLVCHAINCWLVV